MMMISKWRGVVNGDWQETEKSTPEENQVRSYFRKRITCYFSSNLILPLNDSTVTRALPEPVVKLSSFPGA